MFVKSIILALVLFDSRLDPVQWERMAQEIIVQKELRKKNVVLFYDYNGNFNTFDSVIINKELCPSIVNRSVRDLGSKNWIIKNFYLNFFIHVFR